MRSIGAAEEVKELDRKAGSGADKRMLVVGPGGLTIDKAELEELMRTESEDLVRQLAVEIWRTRRRFDRLPAEAQGSARTLRDSIGRLEDLLTQHDVRFTTHDGETYDPGLVVEVLEAHGKPDEPQIVIETVRPTVTWQGRMLCRAQVVVAGNDNRA